MADEVNRNDPYEMMKQVSELTFERFHQDQALIKEDPNHLKVIVREEMMPYVDGPYASYKVLGRYLRQTTKPQRDAFVEAFSDYMITTYAQAFTEYTNQRVTFAPAQDFSQQKIVSVGVNIVESGRPDIKLQFKARRLKNGEWRAFDMVAEGVSLLASRQSEIGAMIRREGIDKVIEELASKGDIDIRPKQTRKAN
nr:ABC transporter substrate-binding protein [Paraferrimonas haliotis]